MHAIIRFDYGTIRPYVCNIADHLMPYTGKSFDGQTENQILEAVSMFIYLSFSSNGGSDVNRVTYSLYESLGCEISNIPDHLIDKLITGFSIVRDILAPCITNACNLYAHTGVPEDVRIEPGSSNIAVLIIDFVDFSAEA